MAVREVPISYEFKCDGCGATLQQASKSCPSHWGELHILKDAYDFQGCAVADGSVRRVLCPACLQAAADAVNDAIMARNKALTTSDEED